MLGVVRSLGSSALKGKGKVTARGPWRRRTQIPAWGRVQGLR